ncbi:MAG TPA: hypothetical protein VG755_32670 [Nannocystaceae bacterium]|nr:hypothetical protein [Nannocystaceae bacterium]
MRIALRWLTFAALLGAASPAHASPLSELAASLEPGEWGSLETLEIDAVLAANGASGIHIPYSEDIVWDPDSQRLIFVGGDHDDIADLITYSESTNTWARLERPAWIPGNTMHGYDHSAIDPGRRFFYHRPFANNVVHRYDLDAGTWSELPAPADNGTSCCDALEFFPELDAILWAHHSYGELWSFSEATQAWTLLDTLPNGDTWQVAEYNPIHHVVVFAYADTLYQLDAEGTITPLGSLGVPIYDGSGYNGVLTVDPVSGDYLVSTPGTNNRTFHVYDVVANAWAELPTQPGLELSTTAMVATPIASYGVTAFVHCKSATPCGVLIYKHAPLPIPPGTTSGADEGGSDSEGTAGDSGAAESSDAETAAELDGGTAAETTSQTAEGSGSSADAPANDDDDAGSGCGCTSSPAPAWSVLAWLLLTVDPRRKRSPFRARA